MPFSSKAQMRYLGKKDPKVAREFGSGMNEDTVKHLPERVSDLGEKTKSYRQPSDIRVKKNVEDSKMDLDKFVRGGVLEKLIEEIQAMDFEKKLKPKMKMDVAIIDEMPMEGEEMPPEMEEEMGEEVMGEEVYAEGEEMAEDYDEGSSMDPRLAELIKKKKKKNFEE